MKERKEKERLLKKARNQQMSWEMLRWCKSFIKENTKSWQEMESDKESRKKDIEKKERLQIGQNKKKEILRKQTVQSKITDTMKGLPPQERNRFQKEERKIKILELKEIKENLWRKWRGGKKVSAKKYGKEKEIWEKDLKETTLEDLEEKLERSKETLNQWKKEERKNTERKKDITDRLDKLMEDKKRKKIEKEKEQEERKQRLERKKKLEEYWETIRWVTVFLEQTEEDWQDIPIEERQAKNPELQHPAATELKMQHPTQTHQEIPPEKEKTICAETQTYNHTSVRNLHEDRSTKICNLETRKGKGNSIERRNSENLEKSAAKSKTPKNLSLCQKTTTKKLKRLQGSKKPLKSPNIGKVGKISANSMENIKTYFNNYPNRGATWDGGQQNGKIKSTPSKFTTNLTVKELKQKNPAICDQPTNSLNRPTVEQLCGQSDDELETDRTSSQNNKPVL